MTGWSLVSVRFALYLTLAVLFGLSAFGLYGLRERGDALALRPWLVVSAIFALLLSLVWLALTASAMAGSPLWPVDREAIGTLLTDSALGAAWKARMTAIVVAGLSALLTLQRGRSLAVVLVASGVALASLAWTGHGAADEGIVGWVHLIADIMHLVAAGTWTGALLGLVLLVSQPVHRFDFAYLSITHRALHGFGIIGTFVVGTIVVTGLINGWLLVGAGNLRALPASLYGQLLIAKLALFVTMVGLAWLNRYQLTPAFERSVAAANHRHAIAALRRSLMVESGCVVTILGLVAWLGTLAPPASGM